LTRGMGWNYEVVYRYLRGIALNRIAAVISLFFFFCVFPAGAQEREFILKTPEGGEQALSTRPVKGAPYLSLPVLTDILEKYGKDFQVEWDDTFGVLRITGGSDNYSLFLDKTTLLVNTRILQVEEPVLVISGEVLVPLSSLEILSGLWKTFTIEEKEKGEALPEEKRALPSPTPEPTVPPETPPLLPASPSGFLRVMIDPAPEPIRGNSDVESYSLPSQDALTLKIALGVKRILEREGSVEIMLTSHGGEALPLPERIERINTSGAEVLVALRLAASGFEGCDGVEVFIASSSLDPTAGKKVKIPSPSKAYLSHERKSLILAKFMQMELEKGVTTPVGPITPSPFYLLKRVAMPSVLVSCGYTTNRSDAAYLSRERNLESISRAIAAALLKYKEK